MQQTLTSKTKVALAVVSICVALIAVWLIVDPFDHLVFVLDVENPVNVGFSEPITVSAKIKKDVNIQLPQDFSADVLINKNLTIALDETLDVPLNLTVNAPVEADVLVDQVLDLNFEVPIDVMLTQKELNLGGCPRIHDYKKIRHLKIKTG
jgi:hypothetical protein